MATHNRHDGTLRPDFDTNHARLDNFPALENDWRELLYRIMRENDGLRYQDEAGTGTTGGLWADHVLTVLVEIDRTDASDEPFVNMYGAGSRAMLAGSLRTKAMDWVARLGNYIKRSWQAGQAGNTAVHAACLLEGQLRNALREASPEAGWPDEDKAERQGYFLLARTVNTIRGHFDFYLRQIEEAGDMDPALALLLVYLRGYADIARTFNNRLASLPELYRRDILRARPQGVVPDNAYVGITLTEGTASLTLPARQSFPAGQDAAGEELAYQTVREEYLSPARCAEVNAIYVNREGGKATGIRKQPIRFQDVSVADTLFDDKHSQPLSLGWLVESPMLVLDEGQREVEILFWLSPGTPMPGSVPAGAFTLRISHADGWIELARPVCEIKLIGNMPCLRFGFVLYKEETIPAPCAEETHGIATKHPALRIQANGMSCPYDWASLLRFDAVSIRTEVTGIRDFILQNELGKIDTAQPFPPFGIQAGKESWFLFGNKEMGLKPLEQVRLKGKWKKLPETEAEFDRVYKGYATNGEDVRVGSFRVATEWQQNKRWNECAGGEQPLFISDNHATRSLKEAEMLFGIKEAVQPVSGASQPYAYSRDHDGFFRVTLKAPSIGFGADAYRGLFTETMLHNSRCKKKLRKELPAEPLLPMLADVELSYVALDKTTLDNIARSTIRMSRISALSELDTRPLGKESGQSFLPAFPADHLLYIAFLHAGGEQVFRVYMDLVLPLEKSPFYDPRPRQEIKMRWEYWNGKDWNPVDSVRSEETRGLTQSGFVEIRLPLRITDSHTDLKGRAWLRAILPDEVSACLAVRGIHMNYIRLQACNGDGRPLPATTIRGMHGANARIASVSQPLPGFGGKPEETEARSAARQSARIGNRHRAITARDYEQLVLEHFPEIDKAQCLTVANAKGRPEVCLVVFSRAEDSLYYLSPAWKLAEIQRHIERYTSAFAPVRVINPVYEQVHVRCDAVLRDKTQDTDKVAWQLTSLTQDYFSPWARKKEIPVLRQSFSYEELHTRIANHEGMQKTVVLEVSRDGHPYQHIPIRGSYPWSLLLPNVEIKFLSPLDGINKAEIGGNFIIR